MAQYKLDIRDYQVKTRAASRCGACGGIISDSWDTYDVKQSIENMLMNPNLELTAYEIVRNANITKKIKDCNENEVTLEENEYEVLKKVIDEFKGYVAMDIELINKVSKAGKIDAK